MKTRIFRALVVLILAAVPTSAMSDDQVTCVVNIDDSRLQPEEYGKAAKSRCNNGDIIFGTIEKGSKIAGVVFYAAVVCRMDKQIVVAPDGQDFMCVFRGESRQVRSLFGSAPEK
jgi:hypothetical protein